MSKDKLKYVYSVSSTKRLVNEAIRSIRTLLHFTNPEQIIVFYTPPRTTEDKERLIDLNVDVRERPNRTESFSMHNRDIQSHYGDKTYLCQVDATNVIFLDCDTLILDDPLALLKPNCQLRARPGTYDFSDKAWAELFNRYDRPLHPWMPNTGVLVFQNEYHHSIEKLWLDFLAKQPRVASDVAHIEQYALALALGDDDTGKLSPYEHVMEWEDIIPSDGIIHHFGSRGVWNPPSSVSGNLYHAFEAFLNKF
jgi:hypothetical protein